MWLRFDVYAHDYHCYYYLPQHLFGLYLFCAAGPIAIEPHIRRENYQFLENWVNTRCKWPVSACKCGNISLTFRPISMYSCISIELDEKNEFKWAAINNMLIRMRIIQYKLNGVFLCIWRRSRSLGLLYAKINTASGRDKMWHNIIHSKHSKN